MLEISERNQRVLLHRARSRLRQVVSRADRRRFAAHLAACPHCTEYPAQMRATVELTGGLTADDLRPQMRDEFVTLFRRWRAGREPA